MSGGTPGGGGPMQQPATWSAVAEGYADETKDLKVFAESALDLAQLEPNARVLDVASGAGALALRAAERGARVVATDFAPGMIAKLRELAAARTLDTLEAHVMDAQRLALPAASFDAAFCLFGFMFFPDRGQAFAELFRVLVPGGRALVATWAPIERRPLMQVGFEAMAEVLPQMPRPQKGDLQEPAECIAEMSAAGFRDVTTHSVSGSATYGSAAEYVSRTVRSNAPVVLLKTRLGDAWPATEARLIEAVQKRVPASGPFELSAEAILTCGTR
jgi:ubiquinone/menaquinone biosynthesis C-methylase UbiE